MKSFLWRLRSNYGWFLLTLALFTGVYLVVAYTNIRYFPESDRLNCLGGINPLMISGGLCCAFFFVFTKRYSYGEAYLYGQSRNGAFFSALSSAAVYALLFSCYALSVALLVRRSVLCSPDLAVSVDLYKISPIEIFCNFALIFTVNLIAYEAANLFRKFKSWKFWVTLGVCVAAFILLYYFIMVLPQRTEMFIGLKYWKAMLCVFVPQLFIMISGDYAMTRGREIG